MAIQTFGSLRRLSNPLSPKSTSSAIGLITFDEKFSGKRSAGNPHAAFEMAGIGNVAWSRYCDTHRRKGEITVNTNFDLNWRACSRPYVCVWRNNVSFFSGWIYPGGV